MPWWSGITDPIVGVGHYLHAMALIMLADPHWFDAHNKP